MKIIQWVFVLTVCVYMISCETSSPQETTDVTPPSPDSINQAGELSNSSEFIKKLFKNSGGVFRGISFTNSKTEVLKLAEEDSLVSQTHDELRYLITFSVMEDADIVYTIEVDGKVGKIEADVFPKDETAQKAYFSELENFLTNKYGAPSQKSENEIRWKSTNPQMEIILKKEGNTKVRVIELDFIPGTKSAM